MDSQLLRLLQCRREARVALHGSLEAIKAHILSTLKDDRDLNYQVRFDDARQAYVVGHMAEVLTREIDLIRSPDDTYERLAQVALSKGKHLPHGNSSERRTAIEERAYGNARQAWSSLLSELGIAG